MKPWIWVILFLFVSPALYAQSFYAGAFGGLSGSQVDGDGFAGYNKLGLHSGLFVGQQFDEHWSLHFEMAYHQKGSRRVLDPDNIPLVPWTRLRMHYIDIPLVVGYAFKPKIRLEVGLSANLLVNYQFDDVAGNVFFADFSRLEFAGLLGGTYAFTDQFLVYGRFNYSLIGNDPNARYFPFTQAGLQLGAYNNVLTLGLRYKFIRN